MDSIEKARLLRGLTLETECGEAAKALSLLKDRSILDRVAEVMRGEVPAKAREMAAWLLGELSPGTDSTIEALHAVLNDPEATEALRGQVIESLGNQVCHLKGGEMYERAADALIALLDEPSVEIRYNVAFALGTLRCRRARPMLERVASEDHRLYRGLEAVSEAALFSIECIDCEPHGRKD
jgi:HEAT repeat protein